MAMLTIACNRSQNITMMTQINNDGRSCIRCFYFHTDSASLVTDVDTIGNDYLRIGREWKRQWCFTQADSVYHELPMTSQQYAEIREELNRQGIDKPVEDTILVVAERHYNTTEEMSADLPLMLADKPLTAKSSMKKSFRWFYSDYQFSEVYASCDSLFSIPITDYVEEDVASYWFTGKPNLAEGVPGAGMKEMLDNVEERISQWVNANIADAASVLDESIFIEAAFEENDGTYTVTINGASLAKRVAAALATENDTAEAIASREELVNNILKDANVVLTFDDSCRLTSVYMAPVTASVPVDASLATNLDVTMGLDLKVSGYGTVGAIEVPAEVVSAAVPTEETPIPALGNAA